MITIVSYLLGAYLLSLAGFNGQKAAPAATSPLISMSETAIYPFDAIMKLALMTNKPIGVFYNRRGDLCAKREPVQLSESSPEKALRDILKSLPYKVETNGITDNVLPNAASTEDKLLLNSRQGDFHPHSSSMHVLGVLFDGWLEMLTHPGQSWSANIPESTSAIQIDVHPGPNATGMEVLNAIISGQGGGLWIMVLPDLDIKSQRPKRPIVRVFSYADNLPSITALSCDAGV